MCFSLGHPALVMERALASAHTTPEDYDTARAAAHGAVVTACGQDTLTSMLKSRYDLAQRRFEDEKMRGETQLEECSKCKVRSMEHGTESDDKELMIRLAGNPRCFRPHYSMRSHFLCLLASTRGVSRARWLRNRRTLRVWATLPCLSAQSYEGDHL